MKRRQSTRPAKPASPAPGLPENLIVCGIRAVQAVVAGGRARHLWIDRRSTNSRVRLIAQQAQAAGVEIKPTTAAALAALADGAAHQGIAAAASVPTPEWRRLLQTPVAPLVALDGVTDPRNLGAVMRVARAFAVAGVVTTNRRGAPLSAAAAKAASGAAAFLPLYRVRNLRRALMELRDAGWFLVGASEKAEAVVGITDLPSPVCWVLGDESGGLRRLSAESCDILARIPTVGGEAGCLNVATACAACLALAARKTAPRVGLEPTTQRLTAACSTN